MNVHAGAGRCDMPRRIKEDVKESLGAIPCIIMIIVFALIVGTIINHLLTIWLISEGFIGVFP